MTVSRDLDPFLALRTLHEHGVEFIVIGGIAATLHGSDLNTNDTDICYRRTPENLKALVNALKSLEAQPRNWPPGVSFFLDVATLRNGDSFTFTTAAGDFDCLAGPAGTTGYEDLLKSATKMELGDGLSVYVCSLDDLIRMKRAAGRPKDMFAVENLTALKNLIASGLTQRE